MDATARDYEELRNLNADYCLYADTFKAAALVELFTENGAFDARPIGLDLMVGRSVMLAFFESALSNQESSQHLMGNQWLEVAGDTARGRCYFLAQGPMRSGGELFAAGTYTDEYVRTPDGWRIALRVGAPLLVPRLADMAKA